MSRGFGVLYVGAFLAATFLFVNGQGNQGAKVVCFYSTWAFTRPDIGAYTFDDVPGDKCTHLVYAFIGFAGSSFRVTDVEPQEDRDPNGLTKFSELKTKYPHLKLIVGIGGWGQGGTKFSEMTALRERRQFFVRSVVRLLNAFKLDGLDIMWMWPGSNERGGTVSDKDNFSYLLQELRQAFDIEGKRWQVTITAPVESFRLREGYHILDICKNIDAVHTTTYDLRGFWTGYTDVASAMYKRSFDKGDLEFFNVVGGVQRWVDYGCPAEKIVLGVPFLGRSFQLKDASSNGLAAPIIGAGEAGKYTNEGGYLAYYEICERLKNGWTKKTDDIGLCPYMYNGDQWVGYEDEESLNHKMKLIKDKGYAGAMVFAIDLDDFRGICGPKNPLLDYVSKSMKDIVPLPRDLPDALNRVVCYFSNWAGYRAGDGKYTIQDIPGEQCTHVTYAFVNINSSTYKMEPANDDSYNPNSLQKFSELRTTFPMLQLIVGVGGWSQGGDVFSKLVSNETRRKTFIKSVIEVLDRFKLDGLNIMWMFPGEENRGGKITDRQNLVRLIQEMRFDFISDSKQYEITLSAPIDKYNMNQGYDVASLCQILDSVHTMSFEVRGYWYGYADVHTPMYNRVHDLHSNRSNTTIVEGVMSWIDRGCPPHKLTIGIALFGLRYTLKDAGKHGLGDDTIGPGIQEKNSEGPGYMPYNDICENFMNQWIPKWDYDGLCPYAYKGDQWVGYENVKSIKVKMDWIVNMRFGGVMLYSVDKDDFKGKCGPQNPLTNTVWCYMQDTVSTVAFGLNRILDSKSCS